MELAFIRIIEFKHFDNQKSEKTSIFLVYTTSKGYPYYAVPNEQNRGNYEKYQRKAEALIDGNFVGQLANYKFFNVYQGFKNTHDFSKAIKNLNAKAA